MQLSLSELLSSLAPICIVAVTAVVVLIVDLFLKNKSKSPLALLSLIGLVVAGIYLPVSDPVERVSLLSINLLCILTCAITILLSGKYIQEKEIEFGEYFSLLLFATAGAMLMGDAKDLILTFVGLEILSIALYILAGLARKEKKSHEAAIKYFLLGAFASAFFLYGIALIYGGTGILAKPLGGAPTISFQTISDIVVANGVNSYIALGLVFLLIGLFFKAAIAPFHIWSPDVYEGAPTSITAFMSVMVKIPTFYVLYKVIVPYLYDYSFSFDTSSAAFSSLLLTRHSIIVTLWILAALTMILGNTVALWQKDIKRLLAYSSIAHAGYLLVGILGLTQGGIHAVFVYLAVYAFMNLGAFGVVMFLAKDGKELTSISDLRGLGKEHPVAGVAMTIFLLSLAGIPPTAGFFGKLILFQCAIKAGYVGLAVLGLLASVVGVCYYLKVASEIWMKPAEKEFGRLSLSPLSIFAVGLSALVTVLGVVEYFGIMAVIDRFTGIS